MKTKLPKMIDKLRDRKYYCLFGRTPMVITDLLDPEYSQICLANDADYTNLEEASLLLAQLSNDLLAIKLEIEKLGGQDV